MVVSWEMLVSSADLDGIVRTAQNLANQLHRTMYVYLDNKVGCYCIDEREPVAMQTVQVVHPVKEEKINERKK